MSKPKTEEEFKIELENAHGNQFTYINGLINSKSHINIKCNNCGNIIYRRADYVLNPKSKCPYCIGFHVYTKYEMAEKIDKRFNGKVILVLCTYKNTNDYIVVYCKDCGYIWKVTPNSLFHYEGNGCPKCTGKGEHGLPFEVGLERVKLLYDDTIEVLTTKEKYKNTHSLLRCKCRLDGCEWDTCFANLFDNCGCPICRATKLEKPIYDLLIKKHCKFKYNKALKGCSLDGSNYNLKPDFRMLDVPLVFELDGIQHLKIMRNEEIFNYVKIRDCCKNKYLKENNYILIRAVDDSVFPLAKGNYITLTKLKELIEIGIDDNGNVNLDIFRPYDFNRE